MTDYSARIKRGIAWLDKNKPGWWKTINLSMLDMGDNRKCILGQAFNNYFDVVSSDKSSALTINQARYYGFNLKGMFRFDDLAAQWHTAITRLRKRRK